MPSTKQPISNNGMPYTVMVQPGQTLLLYQGTKIVTRITATKVVRYFTSYLSYVGTASQVDAKILELQLY